MRVLIAHDVRSSDAVAVKTAAARPWPSGTSFCLLNVNVPLTPPIVIPRLFESSETAILKMLDRSAEALKQAGFSARTEVRGGSPRRMINTFAEEWDANLIMLGAHEHNKLGHLCLGSVALSVLRHAPCSVEIVRKYHKNQGVAKNGGMKILAATDGSEFSAAALRSVAARPWPNGSQLKVISVPEFVLAKDASYLETHTIQKFEELGAASIEDAKQCIAAAQQILQKDPLEVKAEVPVYEERPCQVILHEAEVWNADLIVVGSHGRSGFDRLVMGSVSEGVALHAKCSVEVIREPEAVKQNQRVA